MAAPLYTCTTIEQRGVVRFLWAKNMDAAKDIHFFMDFFMDYGYRSLCVTIKLDSAAI
jgi:hypothetical protein